MPFPVTKLPYGHLARLGELSFPAERYKLQIAAGNLNICPPKFQKVIKYTDAKFQKDAETGKIIDVRKTYDMKKYTYIDVNGNTVTECCGCITLIYFDCEALDFDDMKHVILSPDSLILNRCHLSTEFFTKLSTMVNTPVNEIDIIHTSYDSSLTDAVKLFPHVETIKLTDISPPLPWLNDLVNTPESKLKKLQLRGTFEELDGTFNTDDLIKFYENRGSTLTLLFVCTNMSGTDVENLRKLRCKLGRKLRVMPGYHYLLYCYGVLEERWMKAEADSVTVRGRRFLEQSLSKVARLGPIKLFRR